MAGTIPVGEVIRKLRENQHLSIRTLAGKCGFSPSFISQIEHGQASPSINSLEHIASALEVTLGDFFRTGEAPSPAVIRATGRPALESQWSRASIESLGRIGSGSRLEPVMIALGPGGSSGKRAFARPVEQFVFIVEGEVILTLDKDEQTLASGDAVTIPPGVTHHWKNSAMQKAQILIVSASLPM